MQLQRSANKIAGISHDVQCSVVVYLFRHQQSKVAIGLQQYNREINFSKAGNQMGKLFTSHYYSACAQVDSSGDEITKRDVFEFIRRHRNVGWGPWGILPIIGGEAH